jgi:hypothetical protein
VSNQENKQLLNKIFGVLDDSPQARQQGMKTTKVPGYPDFFCWGRWTGAEVNEAGNNKGFFFSLTCRQGKCP